MSQAPPPPIGRIPLAASRRLDAALLVGVESSGVRALLRMVFDLRICGIAYAAEPRYDSDLAERIGDHTAELLGLLDARLKSNHAEGLAHLLDAQAVMPLHVDRCG
jgi:hypothetical protein